MATSDDPPERELDRMDVTELSKLGSRRDGVEVVDDRQRVEPGSAQERRLDRRVAIWFTVSALAAVGFVVAYVLWPWHYSGVGPDNLLRALYTPVLGMTFGASALALAGGLVTYAEKLMPTDIAIQQRHDGPSSPVEQRTTAARFVEIDQQSGLRRRRVVRRTVLAAGTGFVAVLGVVGLGPFFRSPWPSGRLSPLLVTGWRSPDGERVYMRRDDGDPQSVTLLRPEDVSVTGIVTAYPFRESERGDPDRLSTELRSADDPVMLLKFPSDLPRVNRAGQEDFHLGDLYAFSKICTHMGCPVQLYESVTQRILCPCHQTEFLATEYARPVFGPGTRPLPQLPIAVDERGYLYARGDFIEPVGPTFWERDPNA